MEEGKGVYVEVEEGGREGGKEGEERKKAKRRKME